MIENKLKVYYYCLIMKSDNFFNHKKTANLFLFLFSICMLYGCGSPRGAIETPAPEFGEGLLSFHVQGGQKVNVWPYTCVYIQNPPQETIPINSISPASQSGDHYEFTCIDILPSLKEGDSYCA